MEMSLKKINSKNCHSCWCTSQWLEHFLWLDWNFPFSVKCLYWSWARGRENRLASLLSQPAVVGVAVPLASAGFHVVLEYITCRRTLSVGETKAASVNWINSTNICKEKVFDSPWLEEGLQPVSYPRPISFGQKNGLVTLWCRLSFSF